MVGMVLAILLILVAVVVGLVLAAREGAAPRAAARVQGGVVAFIGGQTGPVQVTAMPRVPSNLSAGSPVPLGLLCKVPVPDIEVAEILIDEALGEDRVRVGWYDRDAALAFADHLRGAY